DRRGPRRRRVAPSASACLHRRGRRAVRLLHFRHAAHGSRDAGRERETDPRRRAALPARQPLPVHGLSEDRGRGPGRRGDRPVLAIDVARYEGEPVAAVAAVDEATAEAALELIDVDYEPLAPAMTLEEALAPGAPLVHTGQPPAGHFADLSTLRPQPGTNVCHQFHFARGDTAAALSGADVVVEDAYRFPSVQHVALE